MKLLHTALAGLLALLTASAAVAQTFPTVPYHSVIGRLGVPGDTGPSQAIPFATLVANLGAVPTTRTISTTAPLAGGGDLSANRTLSITGLAGGVLAGSAPAFTTTPVLGASGTLGSLGFGNATSGIVTVQPVAGALGTVTFSLPAASGTAAVSATSPLVLGATSGALTCPTCVTSSGGGAITGTAPIAVSAAGVVSVTAAALTKSDDTNVTVTLGGTPASSLLAATSITMGWTGQLGLTRGGTNNTLTASNGGVVWSDASKLNILSGTATASLPMLSGSTATPTWATITYPTSANSGGIPYFSSATAITSSAALTANQIMIGGGAGAAPSTFACATATTVVHGGTPPTCSQVAYADIATAAIASAAQYLAGTASELVQSGTLYQAETTTTFGSTTTFDFSTFINTAVTLTANITTQTLSNVTAGKAGTITFIQDGTGSRTTVWNSNFKFAGGTTPTLTTTASAVDVLSYSCRSATFCVATLMKDVK